MNNRNTQPQNSTAKESNATSKKERAKSTWPTHVLTCSSQLQVITFLSYGTSLLAVTKVNNYTVNYAVT